MILEISSTLSTFKTLKFNSGLNILLAERHATTGVKGTRNGTGKTSFIELVHFLLSERRNANDDFHKEELVGHEYKIIFRENSNNFEITKKSGLTHDELKRDGSEIAPVDLRAELAVDWFGLNKSITSQKYSPKFGALLAYFVRKERNGGFASPVLNSAAQKSWDSQVNLSYLLSFDWTIPQKLQFTKDQKKDADTLAKMIKSGYLTDGSLDIKKMQARLDLLDSEIVSKRAGITSAKVVDGYRSHEITANQISVQIRDLSEANLKDLDLCEDIDQALEEVEDSNISDVRTLYAEVGVYFSDQVKKRFEQVESFHKRVSTNRKTHLDSEKRNAEIRLAARKSEIIRLQKTLSEKMLLLRSGIAIERLSYLQSDLTRLEAEQADLQQQIPKFQNVAEDQKRLKREIDDLVDLIGQDVMEREEPRKFAVQVFASSSQYLYDEPGQLIIGKSSGVSGLSISTDIIGKKSGGKSHMQVFCFDWLLVEASLKKDCFPGFLIHDSHIFDGVDGRQVALALEYAHKKCSELGVQYIIAMNSDDLQKAESEFVERDGVKFNPYDHVMKTKLTDEADGGLFGVRF